MVRQAEAEDTHLKYISDICNDFKCAVGLLLGQLSSQKYQVIHFAKTPPYQSEEEKKTEESIKNLSRIQDINENWVADHAKETTKMLPGGAYVLGLFVVSDEDIFSPFSSKVKSLLNTVNKTLSTREYLSGSADNEKLVFHYLPKTQKYSAKTYDVVTSNVQPADFKFVQRAAKFIHFDCVYLIDEAYYLKEKDTVGQLKKHIKVILDRIENKLETGVILFDNELKDLDEKLENLGKKKKRGSSSKTESTEGNKPISVSIFEKCVLPPSSEQIECQSVGGEIRIVGEVISKLWLNSKETFGEAVNAVKEDIMRSLSTRMEMHWDSLTEEELGEDINSVHEPPRRVIIQLPESSASISDYLFPGEGLEDSKTSLKELLDVKTDGALDLLAIEGQADISQYYKESALTEPETDEATTTISSNSKNVLLYGVVGLVFVLILSLIYHTVRILI